MNPIYLIKWFPFYIFGSVQNNFVIIVSKITFNLVFLKKELKEWLSSWYRYFLLNGVSYDRLSEINNTYVKRHTIF